MTRMVCPVDTSTVSPSTTRDTTGRPGCDGGAQAMVAAATTAAVALRTVVLAVTLVPCLGGVSFVT
jgi:hypothetical protein